MNSDNTLLGGTVNMFFFSCCLRIINFVNYYLCILCLCSLCFLTVTTFVTAAKLDNLIYLLPMKLGRTIDYGPYGWLERYDPMYQPFTSDTDGKFAFTRQPSAMSVNIVVLGEVIEQLVRHCCADPSSREANDFAKEVQKIGLQEFQDYFWSEYGEIRRRKLGFRAVHDEDSVIWAELEKLLFQ